MSDPIPEPSPARRPHAVNSSWRPIIVVGLMVMAIAAFSIYSQRPGKEIIPWRTDFAAAKAEAQQANRPLFVDFMATWCGPCQQMRGTTWADEAVKKSMASYIPVQVDADQHPELVAQFGVKFFPHFAIIDGAGRVTHESDGARDPQEMIDFLRGE